ncbi:target of Sbf [Myotisia sp. PD_48]|nr:target of Sbf [Myotisia sp. PD_48]
MHSLFVTGAVIAAAISSVAANGCEDAGGAVQSGGNWYCNNPVTSITYRNFGSSGTYNKVTGMTDGVCTSEPYSYGGPLAPLNEELSLHFRGPVHLKKLAVYAKGSKPAKRDVKPSFQERRAGHAHGHKRFHAKADAKRAVGDIVTATINGEVVTWINEYDGGAGSGSPPTPAPVAGNKPEIQNKNQATHTSSARSSSPSVGPGEWSRTAYYDAASGSADGLTFLNHHGGDGSGIFDMKLGNSLSYASNDAQKGSASPVVLNDALLPDNKEIVILSDRKCNGDCGGTRPGSVDYHGFEGESKIFLAELKMPLTGKRGWNEDMPAFWILNAQIPRTLQYGKAECSCWDSGCGEFDVLEILTPGETRCKSTLHGNISGGDSHYIERPSNDYIKVAVVFNADDSSVHIKVLDQNVEFSPSLARNVVEDICKAAGKSSTFTL